MEKQLIEARPIERSLVGPADVCAPALPALREARPSLTPLEWQVVAAAFNDAAGQACGRPGRPSRLRAGVRRLIAALTGIQAPNRLADPRLEKLRLFLCVTRDRGMPSRDAWQDLLGLGFSESQVEALALLALEGAPRASLRSHWTRPGRRGAAAAGSASSHESLHRLT